MRLAIRERYLVYLGGLNIYWGFKYPPYSPKHISKVTVGKAPSERGERMEDQTVGPTTAGRVAKSAGDGGEVGRRFGGFGAGGCEDGMGGFRSSLPM